jgi:hypothetical protein
VQLAAQGIEIDLLDPGMNAVGQDDILGLFFRFQPQRRAGEALMPDGIFLKSNQEIPDIGLQKT